jgi:hypothetical protein
VRGGDVGFYDSNIRVTYYCSIILYFNKNNVTNNMKGGKHNMSVPVYKRNPSKVEFVANFHKLRKEIIMILMRDFGVKARTYKFELMSEIYKFEDEDRETFKNISSKYGIESFELEKYPDWLINGWRNEIMMILNNIGIEIESANALYITNIYEYYNRRMHWNNAIGYCMALQDKFHEILSCIKVKLAAYESIFEMLVKEVKLLKGVRKSDNKLLNKLNSDLPYFNNGFVYNNYPPMPFVPNYCMNSNVVGPTRKVDMCVIVDNIGGNNAPATRVAA